MQGIADPWCGNWYRVDPSQVPRPASHSRTRRYLAGKEEEKRGPRQKRPYLSSECHDLVEADKWRQQVLREIGKKVMEIQNGGLGEHRCGWGRVQSLVAEWVAHCVLAVKQPLEML
jgi:hypothetical protein